MSKKLLAVIGDPVSQSISPDIHNYWISKHSLDAEYHAIRANQEEIESTINQRLSEGYIGFNITVHHKEQALKLCSKLEPPAKASGAVNTIYLDDQGKLCGTNTDIFGFLTELKARLNGEELKSKSCMILGAGGAAKAIVYGLYEEGMRDIYIANRSFDKAEELSNRYSCDAIEWEKIETALQKVELLVNTTCLGMVGKEELELRLDLLPASALVYDIVYNPLETKLLKLAKEGGYRTIGGLPMLLNQAKSSFYKWFRIDPEITDELKNMVIKKL
jgi:shikimate dehydrogenase